jgi:RNA polymerase sigma-70 factor, ECF subfamily
MPPEHLTELLNRMRDGDEDAADRAMTMLYDELRIIAGRHMRGERCGHTLEPTALVHEAYMRLVGQREVEWQSRAHFLSIAARIMRRVLVDHARRRAAAKRGGGRVAITVTGGALSSASAVIDLIALDDALMELAARDERQAKGVELRFFAGLDVGETAEVLGLSAATVKRDWRFAKAWLGRELAPF